MRCKTVADVPAPMNHFMEAIRGQLSAVHGLVVGPNRIADSEIDLGVRASALSKLNRAYPNPEGTCSVLQALLIRGFQDRLDWVTLEYSDVIEDENQPPRGRDSPRKRGLADDSIVISQVTVLVLYMFELGGLLAGHAGLGSAVDLGLIQSAIH